MGQGPPEALIFDTLITEESTLIDFISYAEKAKHYDDTLGSTAKIISGSVEGLSYRLYQHASDASDVIIVYHGGGVNREAGYDILARQLSADRTLAVCLVDIRGHGYSTGERGTVERPDRIWRDVDAILTEIRGCLPHARRHLLGHSSGAGMLLNYFTCYQPEQRADSLIMLAPALGPFAGTARNADSASSFAHVRQWPFVVNALSGGRLFGHYRAINLNFPQSALESAANVVRQYSVNMANALTPRHPAKQLASLPLPTLFLVAEQDELFCPKAMRIFANKHGNTQLEFQAIGDSTHLECVFEAHHYIHHYMANRRQGD